GARSCDTSRPPLDPHSFPTRRSSDLEHCLVRDVESGGAVGGVAQSAALGGHSACQRVGVVLAALEVWSAGAGDRGVQRVGPAGQDRKSTRLNSSHLVISYAVFCLKKK